MLHSRTMRLLLAGLFLGIMAPNLSWAQEEWSKELLMGKVSPSKDARFVLIDEEYSARPGLYLHRDAYRAYQAMHHTAEADGIRLRIVSAMRTFWHQKNTWDAKWKAAAFARYQGAQRVKEILKFSAAPGSSRHHWGTEVDINDLTPEYFESVEGQRVYDWLNAHAATFGFYQTYTSKSLGRTGYEEEKWHWSYFPISEQLLTQYLDQVSNDDMTGFLGAEYLRQIDVLENYVQGVARPPRSRVRR